MVVTSTVKAHTLPRMGLGMAALGRPGYINLNRDATFGSSDIRNVEKMQEQANQVMETLFQECSKRGMTPWLDCARSYGLSEKFVGEFLRSNNVAPSDVYVSSKWGYTYVADWNVTLEKGQPHEVKDHSVSNFLKQMKETEEHIGEYLDLYQVHSATFDSGILSNKDVHEAMHQFRLKHNGCALGLSVSGTVQDEIIREAMKITVDDGKTKLFDSVQCTFNILEQKPSEALLEAHNNGMDIIIKEGMANGRVFSSQAIQKRASSTSTSIDQLALGCVLSQSFQPRVLSGAVTSDQLISNFKALDVIQQNEQQLLTTIMDECVIDSDTYWNDRSNLAWN